MAPARFGWGAIAAAFMVGAVVGSIISFADRHGAQYHRQGEFPFDARNHFQAVEGGEDALTHRMAPPRRHGGEITDSDLPVRKKDAPVSIEDTVAHLHIQYRQRTLVERAQSAVRPQFCYADADSLESAVDVSVECASEMYTGPFAYPYGHIGSCTPRDCFRHVRDGFALASEARVLRDAFESASKVLFHRAGSTSLVPDASAVSHLGAAGLRVATQLKERTRRAFMERLGVERLYDSGALLSRLTSEHRADEWEADAAYDYSTPHVDKANIASYDYSALLYLNTGGGIDFSGGDFAFLDEDADHTVVPAEGRLVMFTSGYENLHQVRNVTAGTRYVLAMWFTCSAEHAFGHEHENTQVTAKKAGGRRATESDSEEEEIEVGGSEIKLERALGVESDSIFSDAGLSEAFAELGTALVRTGRYEDAGRWLLHATKLDPGRSASFLSLGSTFLLAGRFEEAETAYMQALHLAPSSMRTRFNLGALLSIPSAQTQDPAAALLHLDKCTEDGELRRAAIQLMLSNMLMMLLDGEHSTSRDLSCDTLRTMLSVHARKAVGLWFPELCAQESQPESEESHLEVARWSRCTIGNPFRDHLALTQRLNELKARDQSFEFWPPSFPVENLETDMKQLLLDTDVHQGNWTLHKPYDVVGRGSLQRDIAIPDLYTAPNTLLPYPPRAILRWNDNRPGTMEGYVDAIITSAHPLVVFAAEPTMGLPMTLGSDLKHRIKTAFGRLLSGYLRSDNRLSSAAHRCTPMWIAASFHLKQDGNFHITDVRTDYTSEASESKVRPEAISSLLWARQVNANASAEAGICGGLATADSVGVDETLLDLVVIDMQVMVSEQLAMVFPEHGQLRKVYQCAVAHSKRARVSQ